MARLTSVFCALIIQALVLINSGVFASGCRPGWQEFNGHCYSYIQQKLNVPEAEAICLGHHATLVEIETFAENEFVIDLAKRNKNGGEVWIGGSDIFEDGTWQWISSGQSFSTYNSWRSGEPNGSGGENCVRLWPDFKWVDINCNNAYNFICEQGSVQEILM